MEQKEINIAELLKDCPKGTKLYSPICGECELEEVYYERMEQFIKVKKAINKDWKIEHQFRYDGTVGLDKDCECLLFPSKEVRDWGCFRAKFIRATHDKEAIQKALLTNGGKNIENISFVFYGEEDTIFYIDVLTNNVEVCDSVEKLKTNYILSTGTELKLEEEQSRFKVGDVVIVMPDIDSKSSYSKGIGVIDRIPLETPYAIVNEGKGEYSYGLEGVRLATLEEIAKWNKEVLQPNHLHYSKSKRKIIDWFLPFDKCLMRDEEEKWIATFFSHYSKSNDDGEAYVNIAQGYYDECLPYNEKTAKLIGTTNDYEEYVGCKK